MVASKPVPHWDLSNVYPGLESPSFSQAVASLGERLDELDRYMAVHGLRAGSVPTAGAAELSEVIGGYLERMNEMQRLYRTLQAYVRAFVTTDSYNLTARRLYSELEKLGLRGHKQDLSFRAWIGQIRQALPDVLAHEGVAQAHRFYLTELADQSRYLMGADEEALAAELSLSGAHSWQKLQGTVTSQVKVSFERGGEIVLLPITALQNLRNDPDEDVRQRAYEKELAAWAEVREPLAAALNGVKGWVGTLERRRGRNEPLDAALDQARIERETLETMLGVMQRSFPAFRRYMRAKARHLGKEQLAWWDLFAPIGQAERRFGFAEARDFILEQFAGFSQELATFVRRAFDQRWIDAAPRDGKRGGAFCMSVPGVEESRVLCNFDGSLAQVLTMAHELGHAYHNQCKAAKSMLQRITPMTLAETASIFCETIVTDALLDSASTPEEELAILETSLMGTTQVIVDIASRFLFEKEVFERRDKAELSADDFCEIMVRAQQRTYGEGLDSRYLHPYMWAWKPHYYRPNLSFYNFPYAFGLLFGLGLYAVYREQGASFLPAYDELLSATGEATPAELAAGFGIDIRQEAFWRDSMGQVEERISRYIELGGDPERPDAG